MPELTKIQPELFPKLYRAFLHDDDPLSSEQDWRNVFDYQWEKEEDHSGYALVHDSQVVGMMAMAFSRRNINGQTHKFCNLHTWWVHENYRGHSVVMLRPLLKMKDYTITHLTPCDRIRALTRKLGFQDLNLQLKFLLPINPLYRRSEPNLKFAFDDRIDLALLSEEERRIFSDHQPFRAGHLLVQIGDQTCYILYTHVIRYRFNYCHIHFISNRELFLEHEPQIRMSIQRKHRVWLCALDSRLVQGVKLSASFNSWTPSHAMYRPGGLTEGQIDNLYTDVVMLRLTVLPQLSFEIKKLANRWLPFSIPVD